MTRSVVIPWRRSEGDRSAEEADGGGGLLLAQDLDVGQAGRVVDAHVHEPPADGPPACLARAALQLPLAMDAMSGPARRDPRELLDVNVQQLAGMATLVAVRGLRRLEP